MPPLLFTFVGCKVVGFHAANVQDLSIVSFDGTVFDTNSHWDGSGDRTRVTISRRGFYEIIGWAQWRAGDGVRGVAVKKNKGAAPIAESRGYVVGTQAMLCTTSVERLEAGDILQLELYFKGQEQPDPYSNQHSLTIVRFA